MNERDPWSIAHEHVRHLRPAGVTGIMLAVNLTVEGWRAKAIGALLWERVYVAGAAANDA